MTQPADKRLVTEANLPAYFTSTGATKTALDAAYAPLALNGKQPVRQDALMFDAKDYGVVADGTTDDRANLQTALNAANTAGGGHVLLPAGTVNIGALLTIPAKVTLRGRGMGATTLRQGFLGSLMISAAGTMPAKASPLTTVTADATRGATTLTLASTTGIAVGDVLLLGSDTPITGETTKYVGEFVHVKTIDSATALSIYGVVRDSYQTTANAAVWKPTLLDSPGVADLSIVNPTPNTGQTQILKFASCKNATVSNVQITGSDGPNVALTHCYGGKVEGLIVRDSQDSDAQGRFGYGVLVQGATEGVSVVGSHFFRVRHGFTTDGVTGECGMPRRIVVSACTATETTLPSFDTHPAGADITFTGCNVQSSRSDAFQIRCSAVRVIGCTASYQTGKGVLVVPGAAGGTLYGIAVIGSVFRHSGNHGMQISNVDGMVISGCDFDGMNNNGIDVLGAASRVTIERNRIFNSGKNGSAGQGIQFENASTGSGHIVTRNTIGNFASGEEPGITPGGTRYGVWLGTGTTGAYVADNIGVGLISGMISDTATGTIKSGNRQLDKNEAVTYPNGVGTRVKAGTPADADFFAPTDGLMVVDSTGSKLWVRVGGVWKSVAVA